MPPIIVCPFLLIFAITGSLMAFEPEIDHLLHACLSYVEPAGKPISLAAISNKIHSVFPKDTIGSYNLSASPGISWQVYTNNRLVYIDQHNVKISGT